MIFELSIRLIDGEQHDSWQWREGVGGGGIAQMDMDGCGECWAEGA